MKRWSWALWIRSKVSIDTNELSKWIESLKTAFVFNFDLTASNQDY